MKKLAVLAYICTGIFAVLLAVGVVIGNVWVAVSSLLPLICGVLMVFRYRHFK